MKISIFFRLLLSALSITILAPDRLVCMVAAGNTIIRHALPAISFDHLASEVTDRLDCAGLEIFSHEQCAIIHERGIKPIILQLRAHKTIVIKNSEYLIDFATIICDSGLDLPEIDDRITKYLAEGDLLFPALEKAISREHFSRFKTRRFAEVSTSKSDFMQTINGLNLSSPDYTKVVNAFAVCIDSFRQAENRAFFTPLICDPEDNYKKPRHEKTSYKLKQNKSYPASPRNLAFLALTNEAKEVSEEEQLDSFEKVLMAKCLAEQSLKFFEPARHPLRALRKVSRMESTSSCDAFFMNNGVCHNFSALTYYFAVELGLKNQIHLAKNKFHVYLELKVNASWYHVHPFSKNHVCDFIKY